ncbi:cytochrome P450 2K6-like [Pangasianodon hypophthalmus]|nr:cytochrome P450 2K6-like [Pangasianodon hypophthalmus]
MNLFVAGTDTTSTTLRWGMLLMAKYPHIQVRVHEEIDRVIGGRQPVVEDRKNLPYTDAVIHEIQRLANIIPMSLPHTTSWRRVCLGESLARMELFLFFSSLLQHFRFTPPPGVSEDQLDLTGVVGITVNPSPHKLCAVKRT